MMICDQFNAARNVLILPIARYVTTYDQYQTFGFIIKIKDLELIETVEKDIKPCTAYDKEANLYRFLQYLLSNATK